VRGGRRQRLAKPGTLRTWCASGRWGYRRVRVSECAAVLTAEHLYTLLLRIDGPHVHPGMRGQAEWTLGGVSHRVGFELRPNAVWRFGRVFLVCPHCETRATRLYVPTTDARPECRRCWGLTYSTRQFRNYKDVGLFSTLGLTARSFAESEAETVREQRREAASKRSEERRAIVRSWSS
jgi:hypothetical protein